MSLKHTNIGINCLMDWIAGSLPQLRTAAVNRVGGGQVSDGLGVLVPPQRVVHALGEHAALPHQALEVERLDHKQLGRKHLPVLLNDVGHVADRPVAGQVHEDDCEALAQLRAGGAGEELMRHCGLAD